MMHAWMRTPWPLALAAMLSLGCRSKQELKIGFVTEQTGAESYIASSSLPALEEEIERVNAAGGIEGHRLRLVAYDTRSEVNDAVAVTRRMLEQDRCVAIIGPSWSNAGIPMAALADAAKVPIIATTASNVDVTVDPSGRVHPYMFRVCFIDPDQGYALAGFAFERLHARRVAFLTDTSSAYTVGVHRFFEKHFRELGGQVVADQGYVQGDVDFKRQLLKIQEAKPDLLVSAAYTYKDAGMIAQQQDALGLRIPFMGADGWFVDDLLTMAGPQLEGAVCSTGADTAAPRFQAFNEHFTARNKGLKPTVYTYYSLDALLLIEHGLRQVLARGGRPDPTALRDAIENAKDVQLLSGPLTMETSTHNPYRKPILIEQIRDGKWHLLETYDPGSK